jgi:hypothetical protein
MYVTQFWQQGPLLAGALGLAGCAGDTSEQHSPDRDAFLSFVEQRNDCDRDDQCVLVGNGCAAGCGVAVNREHKKEVKEQADALNDAFARQGTSCHFLCASESAHCVAGRCETKLEGN